MNFWRFCCLACEMPLQISWHGFCSRCVAKIEQSPYCGGCGAKLQENRRSCGECVVSEPKWDRMVRISTYKPPLVGWIHQFKFDQRYDFDLGLARLLLLALKQAQREHQLMLPEVILPVPLFGSRQWRRGFNQADLIASRLAKWLKIPLDRHSLRRIRATSAQKDLTATERKRNLKGAFAYCTKAPYRRVAVVDDVVTTGSTLNEICQQLRKQGVEEIQVWALARVDKER